MALASSKSVVFVSPFALPLLSKETFSECGGAERQFFLFARGLSKLGWKVSFITDRPTHSIYPKNTLFTTYFANFSYLGGSKFRTPFAWLSLLRAMKSANSKYYIIKVPGHLLAPMSLFCKILNRKLVFWAQMSFDADPNERLCLHSLASILQDWGLKRTHCVIAQTEDQKKAFKKNFGISAKVVPSICDSLVQDSSVANTSSYREREVDVLWVANSLPKKRQEVLFELARLLPERKFAVAMNNSDSQRFMKANEEAIGQSNIIFLGSVPPIEMEYWFHRTKIFLNTSMLEGFPNTFLQAWMNGVPSVSLNIDPDNIISKHTLGDVASSKGEIKKLGDDFKSIAYLLLPKIERLLTNDDIRRKIGERAKEYVSNYHSPEVVIHQLCQALFYQDTKFRDKELNSNK